MPLTSLEIKDGDNTNRLQFITEPLVDNENYIRVLVYTCDGDWKPQGDPARSADPRDEETFHRELRDAAKEKGHFIESHSTDPQWNEPKKEEEESKEPDGEKT